LRGGSRSFIGHGFALGRENPKESGVGCLAGNPDRILAQGRRKEGERKALSCGLGLSVREEGEGKSARLGPWSGWLGRGGSWTAGNRGSWPSAESGVGSFYFFSIFFSKVFFQQEF